MDFVARKFSRAKWEDKRIRADAVTGCLRTHRDTLSVWKTDITEYSIHNVALALASNMERIDTIHIVVIPKKPLLESGILFANTPGNIKVRDEGLVGSHQDIVDIDLEMLSTISRIIHSMVNSNKNCYRIPKKTIIDLLCNAVSDGKLELSALEDRQHKLKSEIQKNLNS